MASVAGARDREAVSVDPIAEDTEGDIAATAVAYGD